MLSGKVWRRAVGVDRRVVRVGVDFDPAADAIVVRVRLRGRHRPVCGRCGLRAPGYDRGSGPRRWRTLDQGTVRCYIEADAPRVDCPVHGVTVAGVSWARHGAGQTRCFEDQVAWLVTHTSKKATSELMRIHWETVGRIVTRVVAEDRARRDPFDGLVRVGIDEISYKRHHRYLTVVVDHDSGRLVWVGEGKTKAKLAEFFDLLGQERAAEIRLVSADGAGWIGDVVAERAPNATLCTDPFHVVAWATDALDKVRRDVWNAARQAGLKDHALALKHARFAVWKNPEDLTGPQAAKLAWIAKLNGPLYRAYLLKEQLREAFKHRGMRAWLIVDRWLAWAQRSRIAHFVELGRKIRRNMPGIEATLEHGLSNGLIESTNTKIRLLTRMAYGFKSADALIALALLDRGGHCPPLPDH